ncbi:MAG: hypothetical protein CMB80_05520 [Flammeovirgaceae bacterium]|nr:hypothetical protein [Flammeovirgaceae bacterium]
MADQTIPLSQVLQITKDYNGDETLLINIGYIQDKSGGYEHVPLATGQQSPSGIKADLDHLESLHSALERVINAKKKEEARMMAPIQETSSDKFSKLQDALNMETDE